MSIVNMLLNRRWEKHRWGGSGYCAPPWFISIEYLLFYKETSIIDPGRGCLCTDSLFSPKSPRCSRCLWRETWTRPTCEIADACWRCPLWNFRGYVVDPPRWSSQTWLWWVFPRAAEDSYAFSVGNIPLHCGRDRCPGAPPPAAQCPYWAVSWVYSYRDEPIWNAPHIHQSNSVYVHTYCKIWRVGCTCRNLCIGAAPATHLYLHSPCYFSTRVVHFLDHDQARSADHCSMPSSLDIGPVSFYADIPIPELQF